MGIRIERVTPENYARMQRQKLTKQLPNTHTLYTNANSKCGAGRMQLRGTCWFHAILNVFLLPPLGRKYLRRALNRWLMNSNHKILNIRNNAISCPMRGKINLQYFWSYVYYKLRNLNSGKASRNNLVSEAHLIRNLRLRNNSQNVNGGSVKDIKTFFENIFPEENGSELSLSLFEYGSNNNNIKLNFNKKITNKLNSNTLFGAWIAYTWRDESGKTIGHAVSGYICNGVPYIYDSNRLRSLQIDWKNNLRDVLDYFIRQYAYNLNSNLRDVGDFIVVCFYGKED